ncbi:cobaltochelatase subunit CobN [Uliginosibacterium sediminicola]|uniref:Cobaltochelatase subunit CobN n=1 Tax=Uliginosibacterium sediminicola TaxID=2024550 RepID=A0ABU9YX73_9RHOO
MSVWLLSAQASSVLGIISERSAPEIAERAHDVLLQRKARDRILLRTPQQLAALSPAELRRLLDSVDVVFAVAMFAEHAALLRGALPGSAAQRLRAFWAFNGDSDLSRLSFDARGSLQSWSAADITALAGEALPAALSARSLREPTATRWRALRMLWREGGARNQGEFLAALLDGREPAAAEPQAAVQYRQHAQPVSAFRLAPAQRVLAVLDMDNSENRSSDALCASVEATGLACVTIKARWGAASRDAVQALPALLGPGQLRGLVVVQDFVVGAAEGRDEASAAIAALDVPVFKAIRLADRSVAQWQLSSDGLPAASVQYRLAMPELQGIAQPVVIAAAGEAQLDALTGVRVQRPEPIAAELRSLARRAANWALLRDKPVAQRKVAIIYYNHPPGRQNIGADNLDVPASLQVILQAMAQAGYRTGPLPPSAEQLLEQIMQRGVNLPEDGGALAELAQTTHSMSAADYQRYFAGLPAIAQQELVNGPLGRLRAELQQARRSKQYDIGIATANNGLRELGHLVAGLEHAQRGTALALLSDAEKAVPSCLSVLAAAARACQRFDQDIDALLALRLPGVRGWGPAPGKVMVSAGRIVLPGIELGNVFIGPQPPRGWELDEELLHANTRIPPPHQYLAYYHWLRDVFKADVIVHLGRHSTYEFLPGKASALSVEDFPRIVAGDVPGVYPYIVDGVGEGLQAKRRGLAVMVDHLTPPLSATPLYDRLLNLRQLVESFESSSSEALRSQAAADMRRQTEALQLRAELEASMADVLQVRGIGFEQVDDELLAHEIGHYLTKLQEKFMPHGLHVFGQAWSDEALQTMLASMQLGADQAALARKLADSPAQEMRNLLAALDGRFVPPGKGNDPLRAPEALPTGRNFHGVDGDVLPTPLGFRLGQEQAERVLARKLPGSGSEAVVLWASDAVRDEGVMVGFTLAMMGLEPRWNARGIVQGLKLLPLAPAQTRRDVLVTSSGLFRDLYPNLVNLVDRAGRLALAASAQTLRREAADSQAALDAALAPLGSAPEEGTESLTQNGVARQWLARVRSLQAQGMAQAEAGREAAWRIFGDAPGAYGAGVNRLTERSGAWQDRRELGRAYLLRMGHAFGLDAGGEAAHSAFETSLASVERSYHGRASNLYGLLDNNDAFDYLGGLSLATETLTGRVPQAMVLYHADAAHADVEPLEAALLREFRGRNLNPVWIKALMKHGYAGARTFGQEFLENLWGWQVTRPDVVRDWAWDEVDRTYFRDVHGIGVSQFLASGQAQQVKAHMLGIMMVATQKGFWHPDTATRQRLGNELVELVARNGLPGSGHTSPANPMWDWLLPQLDARHRTALQETLQHARQSYTLPATEPARRGPVQAADQALPPRPSVQPEATAPKPALRASEIARRPLSARVIHPLWWGLLGLLSVALLVLGIRRGMRAPV